MKKGLIIGIIIALVGLMAWRLMSNKKKLDSAKQEQPTNTDVAIPVNTITVKTESIHNNLTRTGKLIANKEADIASLTAGKLVSVSFALGSYVSQGGVLAQVDQRTIELNLTQARLSKNKAEQDFNRFKRLLEGEATTESTFLDAKLNYDNSLNQIAILEKQLSDTRIKAPISGQVISKSIENGEFVNMGMSLGKIVDLSRLKVKVMVSEADVYQLKINQAVKVTTDIYPNVAFDGVITFISGQGDATFNYEIEITLQNNKKDAPLKAGTFAYVDFNQTSNIEGISIPRSALVESLQNPYVYIVKGDILEKRKINISKDLGNQLMISEGLSNGEIVVTSGLVNVREGSKVKVITATAE